jgi:hypothetical protein
MRYPMSYDEYDADNVVRFPSWPRTARQELWDVPGIRDITALSVGELLAMNRRHTRRTPVVIDGESVKETLRERLVRESRELETAVTALAGQLNRRTEQLEHLKRFPDEDPFDDGDVLSFDKKFPNGDQRYSYVAHRVDDLWYVTGKRSPQGIPWDALVDWMGLGVAEIFKLSPRGGATKVIG